MQLHRWVGLFGDHARQGNERGFEGAVDGEFVQFIQRQVHELGKNLMVEGYFAKLMYLSLYKLHELAIHGAFKTTLYTMARMISKQTNPTVKLH